MDALGNNLIRKRLSAFLEKGLIEKEDSILAVAAGGLEKEAFAALGFKNHTLTSISGDKALDIIAEDAQDLSFPDNSFDDVIVHAGLHHCSSPHRALCEMYRVARKNVIVFEAQDSFITRMLLRAGLMEEYELDAVYLNRMERGGVDDSPIPNYIYRWTKREVEKLVRAYDPATRPEITFISEFCFDLSHLDGFLKGHLLARAFGAGFFKHLGLAVARVLNLFLRRYGNSLTIVIRKRGLLNPWIKDAENGRVFARPFKP